MKVKLKMVGFWKEGWLSEWPVPCNLVDPEWERADKLRIAHYLEAGIPIAAYAGYAFCRLEKASTKLGCRDFSDGIWVWPEGLHHYISAHSIRLPSEFVDHMRARDFVPEASVELSAEQLESYDAEFWRTWSVAQRPLWRRIPLKVSRRLLLR